MILPVAVLAAAVVVLPAAAGSETTPTIEAVNSTGYYRRTDPRWSPREATVSAGGLVTLSNTTAVEHGVKWVGGPETPSCAGSIPVGTTAAAKGANWTGTCTFQKPGVYTFYCTVHGSEMTGMITVNASGIVTTPPPVLRRWSGDDRLLDGRRSRRRTGTELIGGARLAAGGWARRPSGSAQASGVGPCTVR